MKIVITYCALNNNCLRYTLLIWSRIWRGTQVKHAHHCYVLSIRMCMQNQRNKMRYLQYSLYAHCWKQYLCVNPVTGIGRIHRYVSKSWFISFRYRITIDTLGYSSGALSHFRQTYWSSTWNSGMQFLQGVMCLHNDNSTIVISYVWKYTEGVRTTPLVTHYPG